MKKFITDYLNIIIYCILGLVLMIASFYLFINYYHSEEVKTTIYVSDTDAKYLNYKQNIETLDNNLTKYKDILLLQMKQGKIIDFYTGSSLKENETLYLYSKSLKVVKELLSNIWALLGR